MTENERKTPELIKKVFTESLFHRLVFAATGNPLVDIKDVKAVSILCGLLLAQ